MRDYRCPMKSDILMSHSAYLASHRRVGGHCDLGDRAHHGRHVAGAARKRRRAGRGSHQERENQKLHG